MILLKKLSTFVAKKTKLARDETFQQTALHHVFSSGYCL